jgi:hypothetical protein
MPRHQANLGVLVTEEDLSSEDVMILEIHGNGYSVGARLSRYDREWLAEQLAIWNTTTKLPESGR